jgi:hypothetical protein
MAGRYRSDGPSDGPRTGRPVSPRRAALKLWADDENPDFHVLIATAGLAADALLTGSEAIRASGDQLGAAAAVGRQRLESHPCPDPDLEVRLRALIERYGFVARSFAAPTHEYGDGYIPALGHQLRTLITDFTVFMADLGHAIEGH